MALKNWFETQNKVVKEAKSMKLDPVIERRRAAILMEGEAIKSSETCTKIQSVQQRLIDVYNRLAIQEEEFYKLPSTKSDVLNLLTHPADILFLTICFLNPNSKGKAGRQAWWRRPSPGSPWRQWTS